MMTSVTVAAICCTLAVCWLCVAEDQPSPRNAMPFWNHPPGVLSRDVHQQQARGADPYRDHPPGVFSREVRDTDAFRGNHSPWVVSRAIRDADPFIGPGVFSREVRDADPIRGDHPPGVVSREVRDADPLVGPGVISRQVRDADPNSRFFSREVRSPSGIVSRGVRLAPVKRSVVVSQAQLRATP